jgi:hypothetical protein
VQAACACQLISSLLVLARIKPPYRARPVMSGERARPCTKSCNLFRLMDRDNAACRPGPDTWLVSIEAVDGTDSHIRETPKFLEARSTQLRITDTNVGGIRIGRDIFQASSVALAHLHALRH